MATFDGNVYSKCLGMNTQVVVMFPDYPDEIGHSSRYQTPRVLYLLHGASCNAADWGHLTNVQYYARKYNYIVIMPEVQLGMYSNMRYGLDYYTYIAHELPDIIHAIFRISPARETTFIAGLSMGGYGAGKIGFRNPDQYAGIGCFSALIDIKGQTDRIRRNPEQMPPQFDLRHWTGVFGDTLEIDPQTDDLFEIVRNVAVRKDRPVFFQSCGTNDPLYAPNLKFREHLDSLNYGHTYLEWKDGHTWPFWDRSLELAMRFFAGETVSAKDIGSYDMQTEVETV